MEDRKKLNINQWAEEDRPREKMMKKGADALSEAELLAILIGSGNREETAVELMRRILSTCDNNLNELARWSVSDYARFKGMGPAKSITIMAALELGKRRKLQEAKERTLVNCSRSIFELFHPLLCDLPQEEFWILLLNQACKVIDKVRISTGGIDGTYADVRSMLREALLQRATQLVLVHNHPSGNCNPSQSDRQLTQHVQQAARTMNIRLTDHVIIADDKFYSFADEGLI
ncbi:DNA repair protein RadC [Bacteroides sp.]|uniref:RadC family protein n=1 Tax=Bacteroides sp. TaxID=29523 RepID=UPI001B5CC8E0|nr:DNA repair protein RadC [Bacteroides sp.]MBP6065271.1 DNA repair protein RadC [Bacteroides sp.]MBP6066558.1 DNA repair protein RadC [Bacteroides sp.]MBP6935722.1 DNA repair protein RadC [Bacteroides sp.]MBP8622427.1 DNA repair protein RadC [Bacteroides sp.]MBP9507257.1 DNA repair protein RadC [Bacteroides sp.]